MSDILKFWCKVNKHGPYPSKEACKEHPEIAGTRCWLFEGFIDKDGYGRFSFLKLQQAHRIAYFIKNGKIPKGKCVLHKCDVRNCVRANHLFIGSKNDNMQDKCRKGRQAKGLTMSIVTRGELNPFATLTNKNVLLLRRLYALGISVKMLAIRFKVSKPTIRNAINRQTFKHI